MRIKGETRNQWFIRMKRDGETRFAWLPVQMDDGTWVWLEKYWLFVTGANFRHFSYKRIQEAK